jgi:magnesium-dependent phosphatase 1
VSSKNILLFDSFGDTKQEMYEMPKIPTEKDVVRSDLNGRGNGVVGVMSGRNKIALHKGSLQALQDHADGKFGNMKVAFASSADTPLAEKIGRASLQLLEVLPGMTVWDLVVGRDWEGRDVNQIGRQPPLSSNKARSHFPFLKKATGIRFDRMLFFDDCLCKTCFDPIWCASTNYMWSMYLVFDSLFSVFCFNFTFFF